MKEGDRVRWQSQAQGYHVVKEGIVVAVIPAGRLPDRDVFPSLYKNSGVGMSRDHESYVIKARQLCRDGRTPKSGNRIYWPRASALSECPAEGNVR